MNDRLTPRQLAFLSAALRHVADAEHLLAQGAHQSQDQAWHLAGFGPECAKKACVDDGMLDRVLGHDLGMDAEPMLEWGLALDPRASRYGLVGWPKRRPILESWTPNHRYDATGAHTGTRVAELVALAREVVGRIQADLWADGRLSGKEP